MKKKDKKINCGQVIIPAEHPNPPEQHEIEVAWILARHFSCTIEFLLPVDDYKRKTADLTMDKLEWEIKSPQGHSKSTVHHKISRASKQSKYIVFDGRRTSLSDEILQRRIRVELKERRSIKRILFITKSSNVLEIMK
ncbi:MAG: hypothetical protein LBK04_00115 [Clostridiales Family XIII bacterium]|jgi:hypothetical protein|nr:hypothetical protein [Clostridiales Family XIII bacterium]